MRKFLLTLLLSVFLLPSFGQQKDSLTLAALDSKLEEYFSALSAEPVSIKIEEADFLIGSCEEGEVRNHVAVKIYSHFMESKLMGDEAVCVHLADKWFSPGKASFYNDMDLMQAKIFAEFNRRSLIGCRAPSLLMSNESGEKLEILGVADSAYAAPSDRYRILYFYSPTCATCKVETILLRTLLNEKNYPVDFYAIMTGTDRRSWDEWRKDNFNITATSTRVFHYWDPEVDSDYERKYGLLQTPKLFLLEPSGTIMGRELDAASLGTLLESVFDERITYGEEESKQLYDSVFEAMGEGLTAADVIGVADHIGEMTSGNRRLQKQMTGDLLYWLVGQSGEAYKAGEEYLIDSLILSKPDLWSSRNDTLQVVTMATIMKSMLSRAQIGKVVPDVPVHGLLRRWNRSEETACSLASLRYKYTYIFIYSVSCPHCEEELSGIDALLSAAKTSKDRKVRRAARKSAVLQIDLDELMDAYPEEAYALLDTFDLSVLPYATMLDRDGVVVRKYISFITK